MSNTATSQHVDVAGRPSSGAARGANGRAMGCVMLVSVLAGGTTAGAASASRPTTAPAATAATQPREADKALIRKLLRDATGRAEEPAMIRVLEGMRASRVKLAVQFDPGNDTQKIQRGIVRDLEKAIEEARKAQRRMPTTTTSKSPPDERKRRHRKRPEERQADAKQAGSSTPIADERATHGQPTSAAAGVGRMLRELRRGWGQLPARARAEVVQGFGQDFLTKYREWIERYYRVLANPQPE